MAYYNDSKISKSFLETSVTSYMDGMPFPIGDTTIAEFNSFNNATEYNFTLTSTLKPPDPFYFYKVSDRINRKEVFRVIMQRKSRINLLIGWKNRSKNIKFLTFNVRNINYPIQSRYIYAWTYKNEWLKMVPIMKKIFEIEKKHTKEGGFTANFSCHKLFVLDNFFIPTFQVKSSKIIVF